MSLQGWQGGLIRLKKAGLNRMDKIGFFQMIFEKICFYARQAPKKSLKKSCRGFFCKFFRTIKKTHVISFQVSQITPFQPT